MVVTAPSRGELRHDRLFWREASTLPAVDLVIEMDC